MTQSSAKDVLARRVVPSAVVALSQIRWPSRLGAATRRALGRRGRLELFFAPPAPAMVGVGPMSLWAMTTYR